MFGHSGVEEAPYKVVLKDENIEIREYKPMVLASTTVEGDYEDYTNKAFQRLFDYISGDNIAEEKLAMTAPVFQEPESGKKIAMTAPVLEEKDGQSWTMSFVLPANFTMKNAPKPTNPDVKLSEVPAETRAAITYSGLSPIEAIERNRKALEVWIAKNGYEAVGSYQNAGYNPPWTIPALRRNEVLIPVKAR